MVYTLLNHYWQLPTDWLRSLGRWTRWIGAGVKALVTYVTGLIYYDSPSSFPTKIVEIKTAEKIYRFNDKRGFLKRSLSPDEYYTSDNGDPVVPRLVVERLKNEAACMRFIRERTDIPVPKLLDTYEEKGSYYLWMEFIDGIEMSLLTEKEQSQVFPQIQSIITTLQKLRSNFSGGPTGLLSPPSTIYFEHYSEWQQQKSLEEKFVFCHGDLSQDNILVDRKTLKIVAIIDWEHGGYYPPEHEIPFYKSSESSGQQLRDDTFEPTVDKIIEFWYQSQTTSQPQSLV